MQQKVFFHNPSGLRLAGILAIPEREGQVPVVAICHGFDGSKNGLYITALADRLCENGIASLRLDLTGHGESEGDIGRITISQGVADLKAAICYLQEEHSGRFSTLGLYGRSFGGNVVLWYAAENPAVRAIVLNAPLSDFVDFQKRQLTRERLRSWRRNGRITIKPGEREIDLHYQAFVEAEQRDTYRLAEAIQAPTLILHGDADDVVPLAQSLRLKEVMGERVVLEVVPGAGHSFAISGDPADPMERGIEFFKKYLQ